MAREIISRYESKYLIPEALVPAIRAAIRGICSPDRHAGEDGRYVVNNVYFETPDLRFYHDTRFRQHCRFKPRIRFYGSKPDGVMWLELKHKLRDVTWKVRDKVDASHLATLWDGGMPGVALPGPGRTIDLYESFDDAVMRFGASPILQVRYVREPWVSDLDDYGRITFDRHLTCRSLVSADSMIAGPPFLPFDDPVTTGYRLDESPVVLEIKTETAVPLWVQHLVRSFNLDRRGFSKYCVGLERVLGETARIGRAAASFVRFDPA